MKICPKCNEPVYELLSNKGASLCPQCELYVFEKKLFAWADLAKAALLFKDAMGEDFDIDLTLEKIRRTLMEGDSK